MGEPKLLTDPVVCSRPHELLLSLGKHLQSKVQQIAVQALGQSVSKSTTLGKGLCTCVCMDKWMLEQLKATHELRSCFKQTSSKAVHVALGLLQQQLQTLQMVRTSSCLGLSWKNSLCAVHRESNRCQMPKPQLRLGPKHSPSLMRITLSLKCKDCHAGIQPIVCILSIQKPVSTTTTGAMCQQTS